jgi:hypothetical protein
MGPSRIMPSPLTSRNARPGSGAVSPADSYPDSVRLGTALLFQIHVCAGIEWWRANTQKDQPSDWAKRSIARASRATAGAAALIRINCLLMRDFPPVLRLSKRTPDPASYEQRRASFVISGKNVGESGKQSRRAKPTLASSI